MKSKGIACRWKKGIRAKQQALVNKKRVFVNSMWCSKSDYMSAAGMVSLLRRKTRGIRVAKCRLVAASKTLQRAQVAGSLGLRSSASHSHCVEMWRWRQAARHRAEEQAADGQTTEASRLRRFTLVTSLVILSIWFPLKMLFKCIYFWNTLALVFVALTLLDS